MSGSGTRERAIKAGGTPTPPQSPSFASGTTASAQAQPPTPHRLGRRGISSRSRATLSSSSPMFNASAAVPEPAVPVPRAASPTVSTKRDGSSVLPRVQGVGALYALATEDSRSQERAPGPCACVLCARVRCEWSFGSDASGWGWGRGARTGAHAVPANCQIAVALDTVCARTLAQFVSGGAGVEALPLYKLHVRRTVYLLAAAGASAARALSKADAVETEAPRTLRLPVLRRGSSLGNVRSALNTSSPTPQTSSGAPFCETAAPMWGLLGVRGDAWRPLNVQERMDVRAVVRSARIFLEKHHGPGANLAPDELAALFAEIALTASVPPSASWTRAPRWQSRALSAAERNKMTPGDSKAWANRMRHYLDFISETTGLPIEVLRQLNAHCLDLAHLLAITSECERSRSLRARSSSVSADSLRERNVAPRRSLVRTRTLSPLGVRGGVRGGLRGGIADSTAARLRRFDRWTPLSHTDRTLLRIEMAQVYRYISSFAVQDPCADYPDELAAIIAEVYITWPVPPGIDKSRHPRWSPRAVPEADWQAAGFRARQNFRARSRKYIRFVCERTGVAANYARKLDADSFDRLHASAIFHHIDTCVELYQPKDPVCGSVEDPVARAISAANGAHMWASPVQSGSNATALRHGSINISASDVRDLSTLNVRAGNAEAQSATYNASASPPYASIVDDEAANQRGYIIDSLSETAKNGRHRPLTMSRRGRLQHEAREAQWYLDCAVHAADSFATNLRDAANVLVKTEPGQVETEAIEESAVGTNEEEASADGEEVSVTSVQSAEESVDSGENEAQVIAVRNDTPTESPPTEAEEDEEEEEVMVEMVGKRADRAEPEPRVVVQAQSVAAAPSGESVSSSESLRDWLQRVETQEAQYSWECTACRGTGAIPCRRDAPRWHPASAGEGVAGGTEWEAHAKEYLKEVSRLTGVSEDDLRCADASQFDRWHVAALRAYASERGDMPPRDFAPGARSDSEEDEQAIPHTRHFLARCLAVPTKSMNNVSEVDCASLLAEIVFDGAAPYSVDRTAFPPWHHRSVAPREWAALSEIQRRERRLHYRAQITGIAKHFAIPPLVVTELDARTYRFAADRTAAATMSEDETATRRQEEEEDGWEQSSGRGGGECGPVWQEAGVRSTVVAGRGERDDDVVGGGQGELAFISEAPEPGVVEAHSAALDEAESEEQARVLAGEPAEAVLRPSDAVRSALVPRARDPLLHTQKREVRFEDAQFADYHSVSTHMSTQDGMEAAVAEKEEDKADSMSVSDDVLAPPVVNITRAQGATTVMYRRSLLQFARQMARDAHLNEQELETMSTRELADIVRNAVSSAFRGACAPGAPSHVDSSRDHSEESSSFSGAARRFATRRGSM